MFKELRRKEREMDQDLTLDLLNSGDYGVLSMGSAEGFAYGVPLSYVYRNGAIYFHCAVEGNKLNLLSQNNKVSFCIVGQTKPLPEQFSMRYQSVIVFGTVEEVEGEEKREGLVEFLEKYSSGNMENGMKYLAKDQHRTKVLKLTIDHITGKNRE
ncbi:pyridoxamine 5'-phosphate oxidase family protein [Tepidibacillus marianensis]|uniref:pyridoxamine 5'-phosphate oxidase family protein n=1 Tax=Tepidibacillus marianensis TaxID=3131995 RepID=UPI0030D5856E